MDKHVAATFDSVGGADNAISALLDSGVEQENISVLAPEGAIGPNIDLVEDAEDGDEGEGIADAAATGGVIGGVVGLLAGIGALTIPGLGAILIGGPIAAAFGLGTTAAATATGALTGIVAGGLVGVLKEYGLDDERAEAIEAKVKAGHTLVFVEAMDEEEASRIEEVLAGTTADDVTTLSKQ